MADIFISYASQDRDRVKPLVGAFEAHGFSVWWGNRDIGLGASFDLEIERALDAASCVIVAWSESSIVSDWVRNEATEAYEHGVLLPVQLDEVKPPLAFRRVQTANLIGWMGDQNADEMAPLITRIREMVGHVGTHDQKPGKIDGIHAQPSDMGRETTDRPSIAVIPFSNLSSDKESEYLADGMTDEVITLLSADPNLIVLERNSTFAYKDKRQDAKHIAEELGVRYVVEGSVRVAGKRLRVTVQLVDAESNSQLWAKRFNGPIDDIFEVQDQAVEGIVSSLGGEVYRAEGERNRHRDPASLNAWGLVVRAATELGRLGTTGFEVVIGLCRRAIEMNPELALAHALLANALAMRWVHHRSEDDQSEAFSLAELALGKANDDPLVLTYSANALTWLGEGERAIAIVRRSIDLAPNIATSYGTFGFACMQTGRLEESIRYIDQAIEMSPRDLSLGRWLTSKAFALIRLHQWESAYEAATAASERMPDFSAAWNAKAVALRKLGRYDAALDAARTASEVAPLSYLSWALLAEALQCNGETESALAMVNKAIEIAPGASDSYWILANILGQTGKLEEALAAWERAREVTPNLSIEMVEMFGDEVTGLRAAEIE